MALSHGVPLLALIFEQMVIQTDYNQLTLDFVLIGIVIYIVFDAVLTLGSDGALLVYYFLPWHEQPLVALSVCAITGLMLTVETAILMHIW